MNAFLISLIGAASATLALAVPAHSTEIAYDGFDYPSGADLPGQNGGTGFSNPYTTGTTFSTVTAPGFNYTDSSMNVLATAGNKASIANEQNVFRTLTSSLGTADTTIYLSFIMQANSTNGYAGLSLFQGGSEQLFLGKPNGTDNFAINGNAIGEASTTPATTESLLVYRLNFTGSSTTVSLYVDPTLGIEPMTTSASYSGAAFTFDNIRLQCGNSLGFSLDEIRFGDSFADVTPVGVPEPATAVAGFLALGFASVSIYRRRVLFC